jgi:ubiquinone/menaquinone biosynthesis C-methylase UbiE
MVLHAILSRLGYNQYQSYRAYDRYLSRRLRANPNNRALAFAEAVGSATLEMFVSQGDVHVEILKHHGLVDRMTIFDLGCGCGRTAQALQRSGWQGSYTGTDIIERFVAEVRRKCAGYNAFVHRAPSIPMPDQSVDLLYHWSVFTHISIEECYLYLADIFRVLKPGGRLVFSFLEMNDPGHQTLFFGRVDKIESGRRPPLLDTFLHRDWIAFWARRIGFDEPVFTDGPDGSQHTPSWQAIAVMTKPSG